MEPDVLRAQLAHLHEQLRNVRDVDPGSNELLGEVLKDIQRLLEPARAVDPPASPPAAASLPARLEKIAAQFDADHPKLAASARRLIDLLGKVGL
jgi:hypothetical protein